jgi:hypothetical protein
MLNPKKTITIFEVSCKFLFFFIVNYKFYHLNKKKKKKKKEEEENLENIFDKIIQ